MGTQVIQCLRDGVEMVFPYPLENKLVGCQQAQVVAVLNGMQRAYPGVELLLWQLAFKANQTLLPE
jgi:hypothetical protein